ncbi:hypothetical protein EG68_11816 [Paragonimus skrjabini miyazakii]|uniref:Major vault protein n=1 Tax=Paragonimus skrjabini miyazakii TaxID=59628 RepID=A0A8S9YDW6_9TREM|nr:hypothetical protein EG68_11816 [Paragonimus skrjabini miyazakii]
MTVQNILSIPPYHYVHVLDLNSNVQTLVLGPKSYVCKEHERFTCEPKRMISLSPTEYCVIRNPVVTENGVPVVDSDGQVRLRMGECEYRFHQDSFPLYPNEEMSGGVEVLPVVLADSALRLKARCDHVDTDGTERKAGDEWLFEGPGEQTGSSSHINCSSVRCTEISRSRLLQCFIDYLQFETRGIHIFAIKNLSIF